MALAGMRIALAQYPISKPSSIGHWRQHTTQWVADAAAAGAQVLVFPEYGSMELVALLPTEMQTNLRGQILAMQVFLPIFQDTFQQLSADLGVVIVAPSFPVQVGGEFVNRCFVFSPRSMSYQDKWFMTRFELEAWGISTLDKRLAVFTSPWGTFGVQICYDIEFPIGSLLLAAHGVDFIVAPSCTETLRGATRVHVGARARAMEQQLYTCISQTVQDALWSPAVDVNYGYAAVYSSPDYALPETGIISQSEHNVPMWHYALLDFEKNHHIRQHGQVFNLKDMQRLSISMEDEVTIETIHL